jgi:hypothetical protein
VSWTRLSFEETRTDTVTSFPTHDQLIGLSFGMLTDSLFSDLNISRPRPIWIAPAEEAARNVWFEDTTARLLFDRGFVVRDAVPDDSLSRGSWSVRYRLDRFLMRLPQAKRHRLLGKIWVERQFEASVHVNIWDTDINELVWTGSESVFVTDWIPKSELVTLSADAPPGMVLDPPVTREERLVEPVLIGTAVGALTVLFFAIR